MLEKEQTRRAEYYALVHEDVKAEFINGTIVYQSPVRRRHWLVATRLAARSSEYVEKNQLGEVGAEKVMISLTRNDYEPDIVFFSREKADAFEAGSYKLYQKLTASGVLAATVIRDFQIEIADIFR